MNLKFLNILPVFLLFNLVLSQEVPPISVYTASNYNAGNQNWKIDQDDSGNLYFANNEGLLTYNGSKWAAYPSPNNSILRSVKVIDDRIYTGCYMDFGYWDHQENGKLSYTSLPDKLGISPIEDEQFWNIESLNGYVIFQSLNRILIYNTHTEDLKGITSKNGIYRMFLINSELYYQATGEGLYTLKQGKPVLVTSDQLLANSRIAGLLTQEEALFIVTHQDGIYKLLPDSSHPEKITLDPLLESAAIYSLTAMRDGNLALGTIAHGLIITDPNFKPQLQLNQKNGLGNNTVLSVFEDKEGNLWTAMDNGINCINKNAPFKRWQDPDGKIGTVYTMAQKDNYLYLGTNQGLFLRKPGEKEFHLITGTKSQVWSLFKYDNTLFCGHDSGTFIIEKDKAKLISEIPGTWDFRPVPGKPDHLIQGNYSGFSLLRKQNNTWSFSHQIDGFDYSSKHFEITDDLKIYMSHEYKGIFELRLDSTLQQIESFKNLENPSKGNHAGLIRFDHDIYYTNELGIYKLCPDKSNSFEKDTTLSALVADDQYVTGKMANDGKGNLWIFSKNGLWKITRGDLSNSPQKEMIPIPYPEIRTLKGYEHLMHEQGDTFLLGAKDGYLRFSAQKQTQRDHNIFITSATHYQKDREDITDFDLSTANSIPFSHNNISITYTVPEYQKYTHNQFRYQLSGFHNDWSNWTDASEVSFENLNNGMYTFRVQGRLSGMDTVNEATLNFEILPPWYRSNPAMIIYTISMILIAVFINHRYKKYYNKKQQTLLKEAEEKHRLEQLENQQELSRLRNEKLRQDISSKSRELAASTMSLIKKNEFLISVRDQLKKTNGNSRVKLDTLVEQINKDIDEEDNWNLFKDAFNNADKDFLQKVKQLHPKLTPNDLRLCAYLRLNLSSKEIAPLLNISVRSVEIKRYRLRKKMELDHEKSLVEYILEL